MLDHMLFWHLRICYKILWRFPVVHLDRNGFIFNFYVLLIQFRLYLVVILDHIRQGLTFSFLEFKLLFKVFAYLLKFMGILTYF